VWFAIYKATMFHTNDLRNAVYLLMTVPFGVPLVSALFARGGRPARTARRRLRPAAAGG